MIQDQHHEAYDIEAERKQMALEEKKWTEGGDEFSDEPLSDPDEEFERGLINEDIDATPNFGSAHLEEW